MKTAKKREYVILYKARNQIFPVATHLDCIQVYEDSVNVFTNKKMVDVYFRRAIQTAHRKKGDKNPHFDALLKPEYQGGKMFISRVGSKTCPIKLLKEPAFQDNGHWALRVPCEIMSKN